MRRAVPTLASRLLSIMHSMRCSSRLCSTSSAQSGEAAASTIAPKKPRRRMPPTIDAKGMLRGMPSEPGASAELSTAELERKLESWAQMSPTELEAAVQLFEKREEESSRVLAEDSLYQMDVSLKPRSSGAVRVFWKDVSVARLPNHPDWYSVLVEGRKVKAFESAQPLAVPSEAMAHCCAQEFAEQRGYLNKLLMPMSDMSSGALHVAPQMIAARVDYLMSFYQNDNMYFRVNPIATQQDELIAPIADWFGSSFNVTVPRIVGIGSPRIKPQDVMKVRDALLAMSLNPYQIVALCVAAQFTSSLLLPLALFNRVVDLPTALQINRAEEHHNIREAGLVTGYHDIREADLVVKISACATTWQLMKDVPLAKCLEVPRATEMDDAYSV